MIKVAMLSKWHVHAEGYANEVNRSDKAQVAAVWDDDKNRGAEWASRLGVDFVECLDELLAREDIDAVIVDTPTTAHRDVIIKAAKAGKHVFTEKALCPTVAECEDVKKAILDAGVTFTISYPMRGTPTVQFAKKMIESGAFGKLSLVRIRNGHNGVSGNWLPAYWFEKKDAAGGAMMDLGCHPMYTLPYLCGKPKRINGIFTAPFGSKVDENAVSTIEFEGGVIGIGETSFITYATKEMIEIYGSEGTLISINGEVQFKSSKTDAYGADWFKPRLPQPKPSTINRFLDAIIAGEKAPEGLGIDDAIALTELLENAYIADETNRYQLRIEA